MIKNKNILIIFLLQVLCASTALAAGIKVMPSVSEVTRGEVFSVDVMAEDIPAGGLGAVQFRINFAHTKGATLPTQRSSVDFNHVFKTVNYFNNFYIPTKPKYLV